MNRLAVSLMLLASSASAGTVVDGRRVLVQFNPDDGNGITCCCPDGQEQQTRPQGVVLRGDPLPLQTYCVFNSFLDYQKWITQALAAKSASLPK